MDRDTFANEVLRCIDRGLDSCGTGMSHNVHWRLLMDYDLKLTDIIDKPGAFIDDLESMFGAEGAVLLERAIAKVMINYFDIRPRGTLRFVPVLNQAREICAKNFTMLPPITV